MKRSLRFGSAVFLFMALLVPVGRLSAQSLAYSSSFQLQNLGDNVAKVAITFYETNGSITTVVEDSISANGSKTYFATTIGGGLPSGYTGSMAVASSEEIRVIHNLMANDYDYGAASATYENSATALYAPLIMRNNSGYSTWFSVQNVGHASATVQVAYKAGSAGNDYTSSAVTIAPGAARTFNQATMSQLGTTFIGSATIASTNDVPLVASVVEVGEDMLLSYDAFTFGDPETIAPLFMFNNVGYVSGFQIQNIGATTTNVVVTYYPSLAGGECWEEQEIEPGASATFGLYAFTQPGQDCYIWNGTNPFIGSARVTDNSAGVDLVGILNQTKASWGLGSAYSTFLPDNARQCVSLPLLMARNNNYNTAFSIVNAGAATTIDIDYSSTGTGDEWDVPIDAGEALVRSTYDTMPGTYIGSATVCGANATDRLVVVVNELKSYPGQDTFYTYNGFGYSP